MVVACWVRGCGVPHGAEPDSTDRLCRVWLNVAARVTCRPPPEPCVHALLHTVTPHKHMLSLRGAYRIPDRLGTFHARARGSGARAQAARVGRTPRYSGAAWPVCVSMPRAYKICCYHYTFLSYGCSSRSHYRRPSLSPPRQGCVSQSNPVNGTATVYHSRRLKMVSKHP